MTDVELLDAEFDSDDELSDAERKSIADWRKFRSRLHGGFVHDDYSEDSFP